MESIYTELALYGSNIECARTDNVFFPISEVCDGTVSLDVGLKLRESKLCNGMLYSTEAWTNISDKKIERMEQVDMAALRTIIGGGHSKCPKSFYYLEYGLIMHRHIIMIKRINSYYHIITREDHDLKKKCI